MWLLAVVWRNVMPVALARFMFGSPNSLVVSPRLRATHGLKARVELTNQAQLVIFDELFIDRVYDLKRVPFQPDLVLDCGCYCGYFTLLAAGTYPGARVVCFEPNPANVALIQMQFQAAHIDGELVPKAVSTRYGKVEFAGAGFGGSITAGGGHDGTIEIEAIDFSDYLDSCKGKRLLWKLDIEGEEINVLPAALPKLPPDTVCFIETHHSDDICRSLLEPYRVAGFEIAEVRRRPAEGAGFDYIDWCLSRTQSAVSA